MAACHAYPFPVCLGNRLRAGPFLSLFFPGNILYKDLGRHEECLFHVCLCYACIPSTGLGYPTPGLLPRHRAEEGDALGTLLCPYFRGTFPFAKS